MRCGPQAPPRTGGAEGALAPAIPVSLVLEIRHQVIGTASKSSVIGVTVTSMGGPGFPFHYTIFCLGWSRGKVRLSILSLGVTEPLALCKLCPGQESPSAQGADGHDTESLLTIYKDAASRDERAGKSCNGAGHRLLSLAILQPKVCLVSWSAGRLTRQASPQLVGLWRGCPWGHVSPLDVTMWMKRDRFQYWKRSLPLVEPARMLWKGTEIT